MLRHGEHFPISQSFRIRPILRVWFPEDHGYFLKLVHFRTAREEWLECVQLCHDAAESKDINGIVIRSATKDVLGCTVPPSRHIFCEGSRVADLLHETEIAKFNSCLLLDEHVFRFNVSMEETVAVDIVQRVSYLLDNVSDLLV